MTLFGISAPADCSLVHRAQHHRARREHAPAAPLQLAVVLIRARQVLDWVDSQLWRQQRRDADRLFGAGVPLWVGRSQVVLSEAIVGRVRE